MPGILYNTTDNGDRYAAPLASAVMNYSWSKKFQSFVEWVGQQFAEPRNGGSIVTVDAGATFLVSPHIQIDGAIGWGLNHFSPNAYATVGLSYRYDR